MFQDVTAEAGVTLVKAHRGAAFADFDGDGRIDAVVSSLGAPAELWHNVSPEPRHWIVLRLRGTKSNRDGIGAKIRIGNQYAGDDDGVLLRVLVRRLGRALRVGRDDSSPEDRDPLAERCGADATRCERRSGADGHRTGVTSRRLLSGGFAPRDDRVDRLLGNRRLRIDSSTVFELGLRFVETFLARVGQSQTHVQIGDSSPKSGIASRYNAIALLSSPAFATWSPHRTGACGAMLLRFQVVRLGGEHLAEFADRPSNWPLLARTLARLNRAST